MKLSQTDVRHIARVMDTVQKVPKSGKWTRVKRMFNHPQNCPHCNKPLSKYTNNRSAFAVANKHCCVRYRKMNTLLNVLKQCFRLQAPYKPGQPYCLVCKNDWTIGVPFCEWYYKQGNRLTSLQLSISWYEKHAPKILKSLDKFSAVILKKERHRHRLSETGTESRRKWSAPPVRCAVSDESFYLYRDEEPSFENAVKLYERGNDF